MNLYEDHRQTNTERVLGAPSGRTGATRPLHRMARRADWTTPEQMRQDWPRTSILGGDRAVFRIKGNDYRLVVAVDYPHGMVFIRFIGTHAEYDRIDAEEV